MKRRKDVKTFVKRRENLVVVFALSIEALRMLLMITSEPASSIVLVNEAEKKASKTSCTPSRVETKWIEWTLYCQSQQINH